MKTAIITGASRGIGREIALCLAKNDFNVVINYNKSEKEAVDLQREITALGKRAEIFCADVKNRDQVDCMIAFTLEKFGDIDLLVNNAGIQSVKLISDFSLDEWKDMLDTHLTGAFNTVQAVLPTFIHKKSGKIINISSMWGQTGASCEVPYSTAKAGLIGFTKALAKELAPSQITVNCVAPGVIETDMLKRFSESDRRLIEEDIPLGRIGSPSDIARAVLYLANISGDYITGQVLSINGGMVI